jgi:hypothetical protein
MVRIGIEASERIGLACEAEAAVGIFGKCHFQKSVQMRPRKMRGTEILF